MSQLYLFQTNLLIEDNYGFEVDKVIKTIKI